MTASPHPLRSRLLALLAAALAAACGAPAEPRTCSAEVPCGTGSWCRSGQCVANATPQAAIEAPTAVGASRPVVFHGGGSHDADPGDSVMAWAWRASAPQGVSGCEPAPASGWGADFTVVFPCAGRYEVALSVTDSKGLGSGERLLPVDVEAAVDPPVVSVGPPLSIGQACGGAPATCTTWDGASAELALSAAASSPAGTAIGYRWLVELPPELSSHTAPRVFFDPGPGVASPRVRIETAGTPMSGSYAFVVLATDARGLVAVARQRVLVGTPPP